jgi:hypothetical protein
MENTPLRNYFWMVCSLRMIAALSASQHETMSYHLMIPMMFHGHPQGTSQTQ